MDIRKIIIQEVKDFDWIKSEIPSSDDILNHNIAPHMTISEYLTSNYNHTTITIFPEYSDSVIDIVTSDKTWINNYDSIPDFAYDIDGDFHDYESFFQEHYYSERLSTLDPFLFGILKKVYKTDDMWVNNI